MPENVSPSRVYKTQLDAVAYLKDAGYKCSKSQFNRDVKARKVPRTPEGWFDETALLGYANANLTPVRWRTGSWPMPPPAACRQTRSPSAPRRSGRA